MAASGPSAAFTGPTSAGSRRAFATRSRPTWPCSHSQSNPWLPSTTPSAAAACAKAACTSPGATATILFAADPCLVHDRLRDRGARPRPPLAVEHDVDALVVEGDEAGHRRGVR